MLVARRTLGVVGVLVLVVAAVAAAFVAGRSMSLIADPISTEVTKDTREVIMAVERREEIVLLSTATEGLHTVQSEGKIFKWSLPRSGRTNILQYSFNTKLGIDGRGVNIREISEDQFRVTIPEFKTIGFSEPKFKTVHRSGGVLSFVTEDIDTAEAINEILNDDSRQVHIDSNRELLQDQARLFYTDLIRAIDEDVSLQFEFL